MNAPASSVCAASGVPFSTTFAPAIGDPLALDTDGNTPYSQATGDPFRSIDFRDVYGSVLEQWVGVPHANVLGLLRIDTQGPASEYWTAENFDLDLFSP